MEGGSSVDDGEKPADNEQLAFHSDNIRDTKAKEKRAVFIKVEKEKGFKATAKNIGKKIVTGLENIRSTHKNNITSKQTETLSKKPISKKIITIPIVMLLITGIGFLTYHLISHPELTDPSIAAYLKMQEDFDAGYAEFQQLISNNSSPEKESELLVKRGYATLKICGKNCIEKIKTDVINAEETLPSADSALLYYYLESDYGNPRDATYWLETSQSRGQPSSWWKSDLWNNNNGATNAVK